MRWGLCSTLVLGIALIGPAVSTARAGLVTTEAALSAAADTGTSAARTRLEAAIEREDVAAELAALGLDRAEARQRIAALSDAEVARIAHRLDELPAGGLSGFVAVVIIVALVAIGLAVTDYLGVTDVYPWIEDKDSNRSNF
jgi:hypothetical protein